MAGHRMLFQLSRQAHARLGISWRQQAGLWPVSCINQRLLSTGSNDNDDDNDDGSTAVPARDGEAGPTTAAASDNPDSAPVTVSAELSATDTSDTSSKPPQEAASADERTALNDLLPELQAADPILAAQAGFDLESLKQAAGAGAVQPSVLKAYIEMAKPAEAGDPVERPLSDLDLQVEGAVRDQYAEFGITTDDLRLYLDVSLDIEDAISAGRKPSMDPDRYQVYRRVDNLVKYGPEKSAEEADRLDTMAEQEMLKMPWPTTMIRGYLKKKGVKLKRMNKNDSTTYDKGYLTEAIFPFEYEQDFEAAITGEANKGAVRSFWDDEVNEDGTIERTAGRAVGTEDLTAWGQAVWVAMQTQAQNLDAAEGRESEAAAAAVEGPASDGSGTADTAGAEQPAPAAVQDAKKAVEQQGLALQALIFAKLGERADLSDLEAQDVKEVNADAAKAISDAAFDQQEESILRGIGYERSQLPEFLEEVGMTEDAWQEWVQQEVVKTVQRLSTRHMDGRSPQDVFEDFLAGQRTVQPWFGVATDKRAIVEAHPYGPLSDKHALPSFVTENGGMRHPAATEELMRGLVEASKDSNVFPEIFSFTQTMWMHLGEKPYHPGNRRVKMHVHVRDLQLRAREENRRQAMHWMLNLIESALIAHPSEEWETLKQAQKADIQVLEQDTVPEYLQYITPTVPQPTVSTSVP